MLKQLKRPLVPFIMLVLMLSSIFVATFQPMVANAATHTLEDYAKSYVYYTAWEYCMANSRLIGGNFGDYIDPENAINGRFFSTPDQKARLGYVYSGSWDCNVQGEWLTAALTFWGWNSNTRALCDFGFTRDKLGGDGSLTVANCVNGSGNFFAPSGFDIVTGMKAAIETKYYGYRGRPSLSEAQKYVLYYNSFASGCEAKPVIQLSKATADQKQIPGTDTGYTIKYLDENYNLVDVIYQGKSKGTLVDIASDMDTETCSNLANLINANAIAYRNWMSSHKTTEAKPVAVTTAIENGGTGTGTGTSSCSIPGIGWVICPVVTFMSSIADGAYKFIEENFLVINVTFFQQTASSNNNATVSDAWGTFRTLANGGLIVIFLVIIFSQITGLGVSNYGIKKMLPRLIIAAILANLSFIICQLAIDISNLLGKGLYDTLVGQVQNLPVEQGGFLNEGNVWMGIGTAVIGTAAVGTVLWGSLGVLLPVLLAVVLAILMTLLILVARQVLIILLVVLAPVAFLLMILPNTESLYKRWRQIFIALLIVYPTIALLFGASKLAAGVVTSAYGGGADLTTVQGVIGGTIGAAISVLPLFVLPAVLKGSLNAVPMVGNFASKMQGRANARIKSTGKEAYKAGDFARGRAVRRAELEKKRNVGYARRVVGGGFAATPARIAAGRAGAQALGRTAQATVDSADEADLKAADAMLDRAGDGGAALTKTQISDLARTGSVAGLRNFSEHERRAAMQRHIASAPVVDTVNPTTNEVEEYGIESLIAGVSGAGYSDSMRRTMGKAVTARKEDIPYMAGVADAVARGTADSAALTDAKVKTASKVRPSELASARPEAIEQMRLAAAGTASEVPFRDSRRYLLLSPDTADLRKNIPPNSDLYRALNTP